MALKLKITEKGARMKSLIVKTFKVICVLVKIVIAIISLPFQIINGIKEIVSIIKTKPKRA